MNSLLSKTLVTGIVISAAALGFRAGQHPSDLRTSETQSQPASEAVRKAEVATVSPAPLADSHPPVLPEIPGAIETTPTAAGFDSVPAPAGPSPVEPAVMVTVTDPDALPAEVEEQVRTQQEFRDWLEEHPTEGHTEMLEWFKAVRTGDWNQAMQTFETIAGSGNPGAREAVASILADPSAFDPMVVRLAAQAAGDLAEAPPATVRESLRRMIGSVSTAESAQLADVALDSLARLSRTDEEAQRFLADHLRPAFESGRSPEEAARALTLLGMAEVPDEGMLARAAQLATSASEEVRAAALEYLDRVAPQVADVD